MIKRQSFMFGALVLSMSGFLVKLIGAIFKIPLTNLVGSSTMGYYTSAYSIYVFLLALATSGIPTGIAAMISHSLALKKYKDVQVTMQIASLIFITFGTVIAVLGIIFAQSLAELMNSKEAYYCVAAIMPAIFFMSVVSIFRGFFQGYNNMVPTAISNIIEALAKLIIGYGIATYMFYNEYPLEQVVGGAIFGVTIGTFLSMVFLILRYIFRDKSYKLTLKDFLEDKGTNRNTLLKRFILISFPIMVSSITANLMSAVDAFFVMNRLKGYLPLDEAKQMWGAFGSMTLTLFNLPSFLIISIGVSLVPSIAAAFARKDEKLIKSTVDKALKYSSILAFACAFGLNSIAHQSLLLFFPGDPKGVVIATPLLEIISFALVAVGLTNVTASILQSVQKAYLSVISVAAGACIKTLFTFILVGIPEINVNGAPIATNIAYPVMLIMNFIFIYKYIGVKPKILEVFVKPLAAAVGCFIAVKLSEKLFNMILPPKIAVLPIIIFGGIIYFTILIITKEITIKEIKSLLLINKKMV